MASEVNSAAYYFEFSTGLKAFAAAPINLSPTQPFKLFDRNGNLLLTATSPENGNVISLIMRDPLKIYVLHRLSPIKVVEFDIQNIAGLYSISTSSVTHSYSLNTETIGACDNEGYLYLMNFLPTKTISKVDSLTMQTTITSPSVDIFVSSGKTLFCNNSSPLLVVGEWNGNVATFDRTTLNTIKQYNWVSWGHQARGTLIDQTKSRRSYIWTSHNGGTKYIYCVDLISDNPSYAGLPHLFSQATITTYECGNNLLNFGVYQFVGMVSNGVNQFYLFLKGSLVLYQTLTLSNYPAWYSTIGPEYSNEATAYFGLIANSNPNYNFQSYYLTFDYCYARDASKICTLCYSTYYRTPLPATDSPLHSRRLLWSHAL